MVLNLPLNYYDIENIKIIRISYKNIILKMNGK
jgi:hypothetical protein